MYEFHGWITISCSENEDEELELTHIRQNLLCNEIQEKLHLIEWCHGIFNLFRGINGEDHLLITGCSNHANPSVLEFLYWLAEKESDSYGIVHTWNHDYDEILAYRIYKNNVNEFKDDILSPVIDIIENRNK